MARNIVQEKREQERNKSLELEAAKAELAELTKDATGPQETKGLAEGEKIVYITTEQVTLNNLNVIIAQLEAINNRLIEGFKQCGVNWDEVK